MLLQSSEGFDAWGKRSARMTPLHRYAKSNPLRIYPVRIVDDQVCIDAVALPAGEVVNRLAS
jgi:hypothetical protein